MLRETLLPSEMYKGIDEDQALKRPYWQILSDLRYLDHKNKMEVAEAERRAAEMEAERKMRSRGG